jgi:hypothetical protein
MTTLPRKLVRITNTKHRGDPIVIELHATGLFIRTKGSRQSFPIAYCRAALKTDLPHIRCSVKRSSRSPKAARAL